ncbi:hypothetical protein M407DRAFT_19050 [Tulasnella calospora MUT 4182]|uniref:F-box domain-containing protein n=1 Tax=Tulasnella calospora MUT 4182 TaxID=1051891 RepID=A0A0C3QUC0_9AGAM|nr:hypothetical protein M407DRAFT_19050 [Tulasnella calospora MUT 4182]
MNTGQPKIVKQPPVKTLRKRIKSAIRQITGCCTNQRSGDVEVCPPTQKYTTCMLGRISSGYGCHIQVLQLSEVPYEILERIFLFVAANDVGETNSARLAVVRLVNRYWNDTARRVLYRQITLIRVKQLDRILKAVDLAPSIRSQINQLSVSNELIVDAMQRRRALGGRLLFGHRDEDRSEVESSVVTTLLDLLSKLTSLDSVFIHADYMRPIFTLHDDAIKSPDLGTLTAIRQLRIVDLPTANWSTDVGTDPLRHSHADGFPSPSPKQEPAWSEQKDVTGLSWTHSGKLTSRSSLTLSASCIRSLDLVNASAIFTSIQFQPFLSSLSGALEELTISSSNHIELSFITQTLTKTLPHMSCLTHLSTNAYQLRVVSPNLHTLRISLSSNPSFYFTNTSPPLIAHPSLPTGTIFDTISGILDSICSSGSHPTPLKTASSGQALKKFTIVDAPMADFLHFHLASADDWDGAGAAKQHCLWMTAGQLGVLIEVERETRR